MPSNLTWKVFRKKCPRFFLTWYGFLVLEKWSLLIPVSFFGASVLGSVASLQSYSTLKLETLKTIGNIWDVQQLELVDSSHSVEGGKVHKVHKFGNIWRQDTFKPYEKALAVNTCDLSMQACTIIVKADVSSL